MKPRDYLTKEGKRIFDRLLEHVKAKGMEQEVDIYLLSILSNEIFKYEQAAVKANKDGLDGYVNVFQNGAVQVSGFHSICKDSMDKILKLSPAFGITPGDRVRIFSESPRKARKPLNL